VRSVVQISLRRNGPSICRTITSGIYGRATPANIGLRTRFACRVSRRTPCLTPCGLGRAGTNDICRTKMLRSAEGAFKNRRYIVAHVFVVFDEGVFIVETCAVSCVRGNRPKEKVAPEGGATKLTIEKSHTPLTRCGVLSSARQATAGQGAPLPSAIESERAKLYAFLVGLGIKHLRFDTPDNVRPKPTSYGEKARPSGLRPRRLCCL
jgi:hypothetical protein